MFRGLIGELIVHGDMHGDLLLGDFTTADIRGDTLSVGNLCLMDYTFFRVKRIAANSVLRVGGSGYIEIGETSTSTNALQGQVVFNAVANLHDTQYIFGSIAPVGLIFGFPYYPQPSSTFGGGAVGLVPYALYHTDCSPVHDDEWDTNPGTDPLLNTQFSHWVNPNNDPEITPKSALMRFYGPINAPANVPPVSVWLWLHDQFWWDVTDLCDFDVSGRTIAIHGDGSRRLPSGFYAALARTTGANKITCAETFVSSNPPSVLANSVDSQNNPVVQYNFYLFPDCNNDNELDTGTVDCGPCLADYDDGSGDGVRDGGITIDDLLYYLPAFADGDIICDIDDGTSTGTPDGGVTIDDLLYFLIRYENGC